MESKQDACFLNGEKWVNNDVGDFVTSKVENGKVVQVPPNDKRLL